MTQENQPNQSTSLQDKIDNPGFPAVTAIVNEMTEDGRPRVVAGNNHDDLIRASATGDILASARSRNGVPISRSAIDGDSIITVEGMEVTAAQAELLGILRRGPTGYEVVPLAETKQEEAPLDEKFMEQAGIYEPEPFAPEAETEFQQMAGVIPPELQAQVARDWIKNGDVSPRLLNDMARFIPGGDPEEARRVLLRSVDLMSEQAHEAIGKRGLNPQQLLTWAHENTRDELNKALELQATKRSTKGIHKLVDTYLEKLDTIHPDSVLKLNLGPNLSVRKAMNGRLVVTDKAGTTYTWATAVRSGVVKFKGMGK